MPRGRKPDLDPSVPMQLKLPGTIWARVTAHLFSDLEGRVPKGKIQEFFVARIREYFEWRRLDLAPFGFPPGFFVAGPKEMIDIVEADLKARRPD